MANSNQQRRVDAHTPAYFHLDGDEVPPSPPYTAAAATTTSQLDLEPDHTASPAYKSRSNLNLSLMEAAINERQGPGRGEQPRPSHDDDEKVELREQLQDESLRPTAQVNDDDDDDRDETTGKPTVHYRDDVQNVTGSYVNTPTATTSLPLYETADGAPSSQPPSIAGTDDESEQDEFDWSAEDDLADEEAKFERQAGIKHKQQGWGFKRIATLLLSSLIGSAFLAGVLVTPALLIHYYWYVPHPSDHRRDVADNVEAWLFWAAANLVMSWALAMLVNLVPKVIRWVIDVSWGHVPDSVKMRLELYDSIKGPVKPVFYAASAWVSWIIIFDTLFGLYNSGNEKKSRLKYTNTVQEVIEFLFFFVLVVCIQQVLSRAIAFSFHRSAYAERVDSVRTALKAIEHLREYKPKPQRASHLRHSTLASGGGSAGTRTPLFGGLGFGNGGGGGGGGGGGAGFTEKDHFNYLTGALKKVSHISHHHHDHHEHDADTEEGSDGIAANVGNKKKGKNRSSTRFSGSHDLVTAAAEQPMLKALSTDNSSDDHHSTSKGGATVTVSGMASPPSSRPMSPFRGATQQQQQHQQHTYPPTPSPPNAHESQHLHQQGGAVVVGAAKAFKSAVLHDARNIKGKEDVGAGLAWNVNSASEAKHVAKALYNKFKPIGARRKYLIPSDFEPAFPTREEAAAAFRVFDTDNNGDISRAEVRTTLLRVFKERRFLSRSMRDVGVALQTLDHILLALAMVILFFISLSVFGVSATESLTSVYSLGIAASFVFKNAASNAFDAVMFLFVTHPFDTGDRCFINNENLVVKKMGLFATVFQRADGTETYYFNSQLFNVFITNVRRSGKQFESCTIQVAWRTSMEKLDALEKCLNEWLATEENRWYEPSTSLTFQHIDFMRYLEITIGIGHNGTWQDWGLRLQRKTAFHAAVNYYCRQLGITLYKSPMPLSFSNAGTTDFQVNDFASSSGVYFPTPDADQVPPSPSSASPGGRYQQLLQEQEDGNVRLLKPALGFKPAPTTKNHLIRARKSKSRKAALQSMGADGS